MALAWPGRDEAHYRGEIANTAKSIEKLVKQLSALTGGGVMLFCYEAGPCGYVLHRQLLRLGQACEVVVAPDSGRIKTDRRDALKLARLLRAGELTSVCVPGVEQEAMRDFSRCRGDFKGQEQKARQQLNGFVLRHGHHWPPKKTRWTRSHYNWLESLKLEHPWQQVVLQEYIEAVRVATCRVKEITEQLMQALAQWSLAGVSDSLVALRGVDKIAAVALLSELGDLRFDSPTQLMGFLGLVPGEDSSGRRRRQGRIRARAHPCAGACWWSRHGATGFRAPEMHLKRKARAASGEAKTLAWRAQKRLCGRYRALTQAGKNTKVVCVAIARELVGFIWDLVCLEMAKRHPV